MLYEGGNSNLINTIQSLVGVMASNNDDILGYTGYEGDDYSKYTDPDLIAISPMAMAAGTTHILFSSLTETTRNTRKRLLMLKETKLRVWVLVRRALKITTVLQAVSGPSTPWTSGMALTLTAKLLKMGNTSTRLNLPQQLAAASRN